MQQNSKPMNLLRLIIFKVQHNRLTLNTGSFLGGFVISETMICGLFLFIFALSHVSAQGAGDGDVSIDSKFIEANKAMLCITSIQ